MIFLTKDIQKSFLSFFQNNNHTIIEGSSIIPQEDNTLLFTNAGMNQFKDYFTKIKTPQNDPVTTAQRCIRAGGKHNDLEQVGFTKRHLTHFTMLGNFSFGKYFKKESIQYAWNYLTKILKLEKNKLWVTVYKDDLEAYNIWANEIQIPHEKIFKLGEKDNFWQMGDTGPCGPCSEIYFDRGIKHKNDEFSFPGDEKSDRFMEIWNLVFIEYEKKSDGKLEKLIQSGIDTGMGLERLASVIQKKESIYQTDLFTPIIKQIEQITGISYNESNETTFHVLCDHIRTVSLLIASGILPHNEGQGYVLRKIIRRALLFSRKIYPHYDLFAQLATFFVTDKNSLYIDLEEKKELIYKTILEESQKFFENLQYGINLFQDFLKKQNNEFSGKDAFTLYDTYGFPLEITKILAQENNMIINEKDYTKEMELQQERSRNNKKFGNARIDIYSQSQTEFIGYHEIQKEVLIEEIYVDGESTDKTTANKEAIIICNQSVFYPGGGGQIPDKGILIYKEHKIPVLKINKYNKAIGITIESDIILKKGEKITQQVNKTNRELSSANHSAVHMLYKAIQLYFKNNSIHQDGSYVCSDYFTIDIVIQQDISFQDKKNIDMIVNAAINENHEIQEQYMPLVTAIEKGATAEFMEKYNKDKVRVINIKNFSIDLCGGCHAKETKDLGFFILKEISSARAGTKRFVGLTGQAAFNYISMIEEAVLKVKNAYSCPIENIPHEIEKKNNADKMTQKELEKIKIECASNLGNLIELEDKENIIFLELPIYLKSYEKYIINLNKNNKYIYCFYTKKENELIIYMQINKNYFEKNKDKIISIMKNNLGFKGKERNGLFQGTINKIEKENFINIFNNEN